MTSQSGYYGYRWILVSITASKVWKTPRKIGNG